MGYTDYSADQAAIAGYAETVQGFDTATAGTTIPDGESLGGFGFSLPDLAAIDVLLEVQAQAGATSSAANALGTVDQTFGSSPFFAGDAFSLSFASSVAFGLFVITADVLVGDGPGAGPDDIVLSAAGLDVGLNAADVLLEGGDALLSTLFDFAPGTNARLYFLGVIDPAGITSAVLTSTDENGSFSFVLDDFRTAQVPLPAGWLLLAPGLLLLGLRRRRGRNP